MIKAPCYKCEKRTITCHCNCKDYLEFVKNKRKQTKQLANNISSCNDMIYYYRKEKRGSR